MPFVRNTEQAQWLANAVFYQHVGIYAYKADTLRQVASLQPSPLELAESLEQLRWMENGLPIRMAVTESRNVSIDTPSDLQKAEQFAQINAI